MGVSCFIKDAGNCRIIGVISFEDGKVGYLTDSNYNDDGRYDCYDGDRIILVEADSRIVTERGDIVYKSRTDYENYKNNAEIDKQTELLSNYKRHLEQHIKTLRKINDIIGSKDAECVFTVFWSAAGSKSHCSENHYDRFFHLQKRLTSAEISPAG